MGKTWKELGFGVRKRKRDGKKGKKSKSVKFAPFTPRIPTHPQTTNRRGTVGEFPNLGMRVEWVNGKVIIYRNGQQEIYNNFDELRVPVRKGVKGMIVQQPKPNARFFKRNGVKYYIFRRIGVAVKTCINYWPETSEVQPPEHLFGPANSDEVGVLLKDEKWKRETKRAVERAIKIVARQNGVELPPENLPVSHGLIEEMREMGFEVKVKA